MADLILAYRQNDNIQVLSMIAWALGQLGGQEALHTLQDFAQNADGPLKEEIDQSICLKKRGVRR